MNKVIGLLLACLLLGMTVTATAKTDNAPDIVVAIDNSYSMRETDSRGISRDLVQLLALSARAGSRLGLVAYNEEIVASLPLRDTIGGRVELETLLRGLQPNGRTDIGLGLKRAWAMTDLTSRRPTVLVLITDGEIDLTQEQGRTIAQSRADVEEVVALATAQHIPICTVAVGAQQADWQLLKSIADRTGGSACRVEQPADALKALERIFTPRAGTLVLPLADSVLVGDSQQLTANIGYLGAAESTLIMTADHALTDFLFSDGADRHRQLSAGAYSLIRSEYAPTPLVDLFVHGQPGDRVRASLVLHYQLQPMVIAEGAPENGHPLRIRAVYTNDVTGERMIDRRFYEGMTARLVVQAADGSAEQYLEMTLDEDGWSTEWTPMTTGDYRCRVETDDPLFSPAELSLVVKRDWDWPIAGVAGGTLVLGGLIFWRERQRPKLVAPGWLHGSWERSGEGKRKFRVSLAEWNSGEPVSLAALLNSLGAGLDDGESRQIVLETAHGILLLTNRSICHVSLEQVVVAFGESHVVGVGDSMRMVLPEQELTVCLRYESSTAPQRIG